MSKSDLSQIEQIVHRELDQHFSSHSVPHFVIGVSGGMDSMSLLHAFKKLGVSATVCHINYQKRGEESAKDAVLVEQWASKWGFKCHTVTVNPQDAERNNFQQWARDLRYQRFRKLLAEEEADAIAVAHHEDDQVETILQKMFRGAGLASWSGMEVWDGELFRPYLKVSRRQIEEYVRDYEIPYRTDRSNLQSNFARNLLRNDWLDKLSQYFPGWRSNVLAMSQQAEDYENALGWIAREVQDEQGINRKQFHTLSDGLQRALVLYLLKQREPDVNISKESLCRTGELKKMQTGKKIELSSRFSLYRDRDYYVIKEEGRQEFNPVEIEKLALLSASRQLGKIKFAVREYKNPDFEHCLYLDISKLQWPITVRQWKEGDTFQPLGMEGHQLISDHLTNRKVSAAHKKEALVVESFEEIICAIIFESTENQAIPGTISEQCKCEPKTTSCLEIRFSNP